MITVVVTKKSKEITNNVVPNIIAADQNTSQNDANKRKRSEDTFFAISSNDQPIEYDSSKPIMTLTEKDICDNVENGIVKIEIPKSNNAVLKLNCSSEDITIESENNILIDDENEENSNDITIEESVENTTTEGPRNVFCETKILVDHHVDQILEHDKNQDMKSVQNKSSCHIQKSDQNSSEEPFQKSDHNSSDELIPKSDQNSSEPVQKPIVIPLTTKPNQNINSHSTGSKISNSLKGKIVCYKCKAKMYVEIYEAHLKRVHNITGMIVKKFQKVKNESSTTTTKSGNKPVSLEESSPKEAKIKFSEPSKIKNEENKDQEFEVESINDYRWCSYAVSYL